MEGLPLPDGIHTCQSGRADGADWFTVGDDWCCPFCHEHGPAYVGSARQHMLEEIHESDT